jgi:hypothetical protein
MHNVCIMGRSCLYVRPQCFVPEPAQQIQTNWRLVSVRCKPCRSSFIPKHSNSHCMTQILISPVSSRTLVGMCAYTHLFLGTVECFLTCSSDLNTEFSKWLSSFEIAAGRRCQKLSIFYRNVILMTFLFTKVVKIIFKQFQSLRLVT